MTHLISCKQCSRVLCIVPNGGAKTIYLNSLNKFQLGKHAETHGTKQSTQANFNYYHGRKNICVSS